MNRAAFLGAAADLLESFAAGGVRPDQALDATRRFAAEWTSLHVELLWDVEPYDATVHYDLVVSDDRGVTTSMSVTVSDGLPWPLRGAQRVGDTALVDVDGELVTVADAVAMLDGLAAVADGGGDVAGRLVDACLRRPLVRAGIAAMAPAERETATAAYCRRLGIDGDAERTEWCRVHGVDAHGLTDRACAAVVSTRLERHGVDGLPLADWLAERRRDASVRWFWSVGSGRSGRSVVTS